MRTRSFARIVALLAALLSGAAAFVGASSEKSAIGNARPEIGSAAYALQAEPSSCAIAPGSTRDSWHFFSGCMRGLRDQWRAPGAQSRQAVAERVRRLVSRQMAQPNVGYRRSGGAWRGEEGLARFRSDLRAGRDVRYEIAELNQVGQPYNGMGQTGLAYFMLVFAQFAEEAGYSGHGDDAQFYRALGEAMLRPVATPADRGGLQTAAPCRANTSQRCAWFHSVTRRDRPADFGATLNQNLHVIRDLGLAADLYARNRWPEPFDFDRVIAEGLNQLFRQAPRLRAGDEPALADFLAPPAGREGVQWLYYGFNADKPPGEGGYFLSRRGKNCQYQVHSLALISQILTKARETRRWPVERALACDGALAKAYRGTRVRMEGGGEARWSDARTDFDTTCRPVQLRAFAQAERSFYRDAFARCGS